MALFASNVLIYILIGIAILAPLYIRRDIWYAGLSCATCAAGWIGAFIVKHLFQVPRPFIAMHVIPLFPESGFSFPSSHVTIFAALSVVMWKLDRRLGIVFSICTFFIALSRMIIGVHYPLDVLGGAVLGLVIGACSIRVFQLFRQVAFSSKTL